MLIQNQLAKSLSVGNKDINRFHYEDHWLLLTWYTLMCNKLGSIGFLNHPLRSCFYWSMKPFNNEYVIKIGKRLKDMRVLNLFNIESHVDFFQHKTVYVHLCFNHSLTRGFHSFWDLSDLSDTRGYSSKLQHVVVMTTWCHHGRLYMIVYLFHIISHGK